MIGIIDYGLGNLGSIRNMLKVVGARSIISSDPAELESCDKLILPGVGAFDAGMRNLGDRGLDQAVQDLARQNMPLLGICLGMQLLGMRSEEGMAQGLGLINFESKRFELSSDLNLRVPHMGWDVVEFTKQSPLTEGIEGRQRYYFVHSYYAQCAYEEDVLMTCDYGITFAASVNSGNVYGVQFHPEKSHDFGMRLLQNFAESC